MELGQVQLGSDLVMKAELKGGKLVCVFEFAAQDLLKLLVDKVEQAVPGDQQALAEMIKANLNLMMK